MLSSRAQLDAMFARYPPEVESIGRDAMTKLRRILPGWTAMVYDTYNALVIGFTPNDRPSDAICSIALYPRWVNLYFLSGAFLDDPERLLQGRGNRVRRIRLVSAADLDTPGVRALLAQARDESPKPAKTTRGTIVIRAIAKKQRPRR